MKNLMIETRMTKEECVCTPPALVCTAQCCTAGNTCDTHPPLFPLYPLFPLFPLPPLHCSRSLQVQAWEESGSSPVTHYILSFLSFQGSQIQSDPGSIWQTGGGSTADFTLAPKLAAAMGAAQKRHKKVLLSIGGELGSSQFIQYWQSKGSTSAERVAGMRKDLHAVIDIFEHQNAKYGVAVDGIDIDIELGGGYEPAGEKYTATRDLINAVPEELLVAFVPQVGNGLCAAPVVGDLKHGLTPTDVLAGQCLGPAATGASWSLAQLDKDCLKADGTKKLDWLGIQYYNAVGAVCCGGGATTAQATLSVTQNYKNLAMGWPAVTAEEMADEASPWHQWQWWPGPWAAFDGIGADRLVLGKPGCAGCAGSNYFDAKDMNELFTSLTAALAPSKQGFGGMLFWDLCRLFGSSGRFCVNSHCQPSWGGTGQVKQGLEGLYAKMKTVHP